MNLQEFAKLKAGDKIRNEITQSTGEVTEATPGGVRVRWGTGPEFPYPVNGTSWFHWSKVEDAITAVERGIEDGVGT